MTSSDADCASAKVGQVRLCSQLAPLGFPLRDYQEDMRRRVLEAWERHRSVMVQMPTGTGKTHLLASLIRDFAGGEEGARVWIVAHRRELVGQIEDTLSRFGIRTGEGRVAAMSVQRLSRHWDDFREAPSLVVIDEAHHALAETYRELWRRYPGARKLGVTATPCRMDGRGFTDLFGTLVSSGGVAGFILRGWLSPFDYVSVREDSEERRLVEGLTGRGADGDYRVKEMDAVLNRRPSIERLYGSVLRYAEGKKGIVYAVSVAHARNIARYYSERGIGAAAIDGGTPSSERARLVEAFREGKLRVLVNVDVFSEGFDCPDVEFVQMARPTLSLSKYLQQVGRGLRRVPGKDGCVLIDNVGLYRLFGLPVAERDWDAMFEGRLSGKGNPREARAERRDCPAFSRTPPAPDEAGDGTSREQGQARPSFSRTPSAPDEAGGGASREQSQVRLAFSGTPPAPDEAGGGTIREQSQVRPGFSKTPPVPDEAGGGTIREQGQVRPAFSGTPPAPEEAEGGANRGQGQVRSGFSKIPPAPDEARGGASREQGQVHPDFSGMSPALEEFGGKPRAAVASASSSVPEEYAAGGDCGMEVVVTREELPSVLERMKSAPSGGEEAELGAWRDGAGGLWGLRRGRTKVTGAAFAEVCGLRYGMAAVRFPDGRFGLVDGGGKVVRTWGGCRSVRFARDRFLVVRMSDGGERHLDLWSMRAYGTRPEVRRFGNVELLKVGRAYYSRTRRVYVNDQGIDEGHVSVHVFGITVLDHAAAVPCSPRASGAEVLRWGYACILDGDRDRCYWLCRRLADGTAVVTDGEGRYYRVGGGREKEYVGSDCPAEGRESCPAKIERLARRIAGERRAAEAERAESRRNRIFSRAGEAVPFRSGTKWGLKVGGRVTVPPIYRSVHPPVGRYCAVEEGYERWGVVSLDGTLVVEPRYSEIEISVSGIATGTNVTGRKVSVKLP